MNSRRFQRDRSKFWYDERRSTPLFGRGWSGKLMRQTATALLILVLVVVLQRLPFAVLQGPKMMVRSAMTEDLDLASAWERVRGFSWEKAMTEGWGSLSSQAQPAERRKEILAGMIAPVKGQVITGFGWQEGKAEMHPGLDLSASEGSAIKAAQEGRVVAVSASSEMGKIVEIDHGEQVSTFYAHCGNVLVSEGQSVEQGDDIALVGLTGDTEVPHLHFEIRVEGKQIDPRGKIGY